MTALILAALFSVFGWQVVPQPERPGVALVCHSAPPAGVIGYTDCVEIRLRGR